MRVNGSGGVGKQSSGNVIIDYRGYPLDVVDGEAAAGGGDDLCDELFQ